MGEKLKMHVTEVIQMEIRNSHRMNDPSVATSRSMTPALLVHERQTAITQYIAAGQFNRAFQEV